MKKSLNYILLLVSVGISFSFLRMPTPPKKMAFFRAIKMISYTDTFENARGFTGTSMIYETPTIAGLDPYKTIQDGKVKLNASELKFNSVINIYIDTARREQLTAINWNVINSTQFQNLNYTTTKTIPSFTNIACIPKTISKSSNYTLNFGTITNVDKIEFNIENDQFMTSVPYYRKVPANINCLVIPNAHLSCLNINPQARVRISFINEEELIVNNKTIVFENRLDIIKFVSIVN